MCIAVYRDTVICPVDSENISFPRKLSKEFLKKKKFCVLLPSMNIKIKDAGVQKHFRLFWKSLMRANVLGIFEGKPRPRPLRQSHQ